MVDFYILLIGETMSELAEIESHYLYGKYPSRLPVWWARTGEVMKQPELLGVSGKKIIIMIQKKFGRFERFLAKIFNAPKELRRPLDEMNSLLWELCNGQRTFEEICAIMNQTFHDEISPVIHRTERAIAQFVQLQFMIILPQPLNNKWNIRPGVIPKGQELKIDAEVYDTTPLDGEMP